MKIPIKLCALLVLLLNIYACSEKKKQEVQKGAKNLNLDSLKIVWQNEIREKDIEEFFVGYEPDESLNAYGMTDKIPYTFSERTKVFVLPNTKSEVADELPFATRLDVVRGLGKVTINENTWWKIHMPNQKYGFVLAKDLSNYQVYFGSEISQFLISEIEVMEKGQLVRRCEIRRFTDDQHRVLEKIKTKELEAGHRFEYLSNCSFKGSKNEDMSRLLIFETFRESCPGGGTIQFFVDDGKKMRHVIDVSTTGEAGYFDCEKAYLPLQFSNGKILLVENGNLEQIFNHENGDLNVFPYPTDCDIPIEKLLVVVHEVNDVEGIDMEIEPEKLPIYKTTTLYEWVGNKLVKWKEIKEKIMPE